MVVVKKTPGQSDDALIRTFQRKVQIEGIIQEVRDRQVYLKPSAARKKKREDARRQKRFIGNA